VRENKERHGHGKRNPALSKQWEKKGRKKKPFRKGGTNPRKKKKVSGKNSQRGGKKTVKGMYTPEVGKFPEKKKPVEGNHSGRKKILLTNKKKRPRFNTEIVITTRENPQKLVEKEHKWEGKRLTKERLQAPKKKLGSTLSAGAPHENDGSRKRKQVRQEGAQSGEGRFIFKKKSFSGETPEESEAVKPLGDEKKGDSWGKSWEKKKKEQAWEG